MSTRIFVNLPVKDLDRSMAFYERLDFEPDLRFTNDSSACLEIADGLYLMLLTEARFRERIGGPSCDAQRSSEVLVSLALDSHQEVDDLLNKAVAAGARVHGEPQDHDFLHARTFRDPDGHLWELVHQYPDVV
ncbi:VOC family protein [Pseudomonas indica]|uniref:VOC family protein n=1 Tax=Pseudomonas indica TaxID=137658 RepID=UPI000BAC0B26|nr:VOC family protein [Pseudomonas indica]PAU60989.1 hypothetical protein BZL42_09185 [Pseudomonas indica]